MFLVTDMLRATASNHPARPALLSPREDVDFATLDHRTDHAALALLHLGVRPGDRVAVMGENSPQFAVALLAILKAGGVAVPIGGGVKSRRLAFVLADSGASVLIADAQCQPAVADARAAGFAGSTLWLHGGPDGEPRLNEAWSAPRPRAPANLPGDASIDQDLALLIYTSGTTGQPKGVMLTHRNLVNSTAAITRYLANTPDDVVAGILPLAYSYGLCQLLGAIRVGYALAIERSFAFPADVLARLASRGVTGFPALPPIFARLAQTPPPPLPSLRYTTNAAAALPTPHLRAIRAHWSHADFFSMYGQTECTRATYLTPALVDRFPSSSGTAMPNCQTTIVDEMGHPLAPNQVGELVVRGSNVMRGYWNRPDDTARALRPIPGRPGELALHTGDLFRTDDQGLHYFVGRLDDIFKCRGEKVSPREIEDVVCELPEVAEAAVVGVPDPADGLAIRLIVVPREGCELSESRLRAHCRSRLDPALMPKFVVPRASLPRTESGKVDRGSLARGG